MLTIRDRSERFTRLGVTVFVGVTAALASLCSCGTSKNGGGPDADAGADGSADGAVASRAGIQLLAGSPGGSGFLDGPETVALFGRPTSVVADAAGNLFIADADNHVIRRVSAGGVVSTLAGAAGKPGAANGAGQVARFNEPRGVALAPDGSVYVADALNHAIRRVTLSGEVSTFVGALGQSGAVNGDAATARFNQPSGVTFDTAGNLIVVDQYNHAIRKVTSVGTVSTFAGELGAMGTSDGAGAAAHFAFPYAAAGDANGVLYVADTFSHTIRTIDTDGNVATWAGTAGQRGSMDAAGTSARFDNPHGVTVDGAGNVFVADTNNCTIRKIDGSRVVSTWAGAVGQCSFLSGLRAAARLNLPMGLGADGTGNVFIADMSNFVIRKMSNIGEVTRYAGLPPLRGALNGAAAAARFDFVYGLAIDAGGAIYAADQNNHAIRKITPSGDVTTLVGKLGQGGFMNGALGDALFFRPYGLAIDTSGDLFVLDSFNEIIRRVTTAGQVTTFAGTLGQAGGSDGMTTAAMFRKATGVVLSPSGNLYVSDTENHTVRQITSGGAVTTLAGSPQQSGAVNARGAAARFNTPRGIAVDGSGTLYVADAANHAIRQVTADGNVTTFAGALGQSGFENGASGNARFNAPFGVAMSASGDLYVADQGNHAVRKITRTGEVMTIAGTSGVAAVVGGKLPGSLNRPTGIAIAPDRTLVVSSNSEQVLVRITLE